MAKRDPHPVSPRNHPELKFTGVTLTVKFDANRHAYCWVCHAPNTYGTFHPLVLALVNSNRLGEWESIEASVALCDACADQVWRTGGDLIAAIGAASRKTAEPD